MVRAMSTEKPGRTIALEALAAFLGLLGLYHATRQAHYWGDAKFILQWVENGRLDYYHVAYLPLAQLVHGVCGRFGFAVEDSLRVLSVVCGAGSGALLFAAARCAGAGRVAAGGATLLYATAPVAWFFAGAIEIHAVQMLASGGVCLWAARGVRAGEFGRDPAAVMVALLAIVAGHLTGVTWAPATAFVLWRGGRGAGFGRWVTVSVAALAFALVWLQVDRESERGAYHLELGLRALLRLPSLALGWRELLAPAGVVWALVLAAVLLAWRARRLDLRRLEVQATLLLFAASMPLAFLIDIAERGAYFVALLPVACLWLALAGDALPRAALAAVLCVTVPLQTWLGHASLKSFESVALPAELAWLETLQAEAGTRLLLLSTDTTLAAPVQQFTPLTCVIVVPGMGIDLTLPDVRTRLVERAGQKSAEGYRIAFTSELFAAEPGTTFIAELAAQLGTPEPGRDSHYALFPLSP
jgi:hypothetical protein